MSIVLHLFMLDWLGADHLAALLARIAAASAEANSGSPPARRPPSACSRSQTASAAASLDTTSWAS